MRPPVNHQIPSTDRLSIIRPSFKSDRFRTAAPPCRRLDNPPGAIAFRQAAAEPLQHGLDRVRRDLRRPISTTGMSADGTSS